jgi:membrane associated rhomboid family serine protease
MSLISLLIVTGMLLAALIQLVLHLPSPLRRAVTLVPGWLQTAILHFGYGGWIGGVQGHLCGAVLSLPYFFLYRWYLRSRMLERYQQ